MKQIKNKNVYTINGAQFAVDERYRVIKPIGYGAYGLVCSAQDTETQTKVAIKKVPKLFQDLVDGKRILREIKLLKSFKHENIINIKDICIIPNKDTYDDIYFISELMPTDLHQVIKSKQKLSTEHLQYFSYQILRGLKYIHSANVMHRDLKPSNILVSGNCDVKICDFGLARGKIKTEEQDLTEYVVTRWYRAPELILMCQEYSEAIDIWSVGCMLAELILRRPLFPGKNYLHQLDLITDLLGTPSEDDKSHITHQEALQYLNKLPKKRPKSLRSVLPMASALEIDLLSRMLVFNPAKRINTKDALKHPYFKELHDEEKEPESKTQFSFAYDNVDITEEQLRDMLYKEMLDYHPDLNQ